MADYAFLTTWCIEAPITDVFDILHDAENYPTWWPGVKRVEQLEPGDADGIGQLDRFTWRSVLPYELTFDLRVTTVTRPHLIQGHATGELEGIGTWHVYEGQETAVVYDWRVRTTKRWMNTLGPLARPAFAWNHDLVMRQGGRGLAARLNAGLLLHD